MFPPADRASRKRLLLNLHIRSLLVASLTIGVATRCFAAATVLDEGSFVVTQRDHAVGAETFSLEVTHDSLNVFSRSYFKVPGQAGQVEADKQMVLVVNRDDYGLVTYQSNFRIGGREIIRGIVIGDTTLTIYRELDGAGEGMSHVRPPGRLFVMDPQLYTLVDVIARSLHGRTFETWPVPLVTLGSQDSVLTATARDLGREAIHWGKRSVRARKLSLSDGTTTFTLWVDPADGRMLRLEHAASGLRVERQPQPARKPKSASPSPPPPGG